jgi:hypothetical protein
MARRSKSGAVTGGLFGMICCAALGAGVSLALLPKSLQAQYGESVDDLLMSLIMHGLIWGLVGAAAGTALAVGLGERRRIPQFLTAGLIGAVVGAAAFDLIGATCWIDAGSTDAISYTWPTRLLARLLVTIGTATALVITLPRARVVAAKIAIDAA